MVIQYAGASRGTLILHNDEIGEWDEALSVSTDDACNSSTNDTEASLRVGGKLRDLVPLSMLNYIASTREMCVINNHPSSKCMFSSDEYFQSFSPKAVLMLPVIHQVYSPILRSVVFLSYFPAQ